MDTETIQAKGLGPVQGLLDSAHGVADLTELAAFLGVFERIGGPGPVRLLHHARPRRRVEEHRLPRAGRPRPARRVLLPRGQVRRDPREVPRLPDDAAHPQRARRPGRRGRARAGVRVPAGRGPLGGRRDPRRPEDDQPPEPRGAARALPGVRLDHLRHRPRRHRGDAAALDRHAARLLLATCRRCWRRRRSRPGARSCTSASCGARRPTCPTRSSRPTSTSTAAPSTAPRSCAPAGSAASTSSRAPSARPSARSTSSGTSRRRPSR